MSMSGTLTQQTGSVGDSNTGNYLLIFMGALAIAVFAWFLSTQAANVDRSIIGTNGFVSYAKSRDIDVRIFGGQGKLDGGETGLRILPLYTPRLDTLSFVEKQKNEEEKEVLRPMTSLVLGRKIKAIPTLLVLPKWRNGALTLERLHPKLLVDLKGKVFAAGGEIRRGPDNFESFEFQAKSGSGFRSFGEAPATLFLAQTLNLSAKENPRCKPVLASGKDVLLAQCEWQNSGVGYWVLSDPDLLNNHGAGAGENIETALAIVKQLAGDKQVILDQTNRFFGKDADSKKSVRDDRKRTFADLARFFGFPFTYIWLAFAVLVFFALWHSGRRAGPVDDGDEENAIHVSKNTAIDANINILRAAGNNGALAKRHVEQRMDRLAAEVLGNNRKAGVGGREQLLGAVERRSAELGKQLRTANEKLSGGTPDGGNLFAQLNTFEKLIDEVRHAFGRSAGAGR